MLSLARKLLPAWVWAALLGLGVVGGLGWYGVNTWEDRVEQRQALEQQLEAVTANRDRWYQRTMDVLGQLGDERQRAREAEAAVVELQQALEAREAGYRQARQRVQAAPPEDDGPVAPVLRQALEDLP
ncbi:MAG: hypothetical protein ACQEXC_00535 [Pseudomonadota bacterium]